jgi:histidinol-phosphate aminotransferase
MSATRKSLCDWLTAKNLRFIDPQANFMMIDIGRESTTVAPKMLERGVAVGRRFPALSKMMRVTIGTDQEMAKFREVFWEVMQSA